MNYIDKEEYQRVLTLLDVVTVARNNIEAERDALRVEYESRTIWIRKMLEVLGITNDDGMNCVDAHEYAGAMKAALRVALGLSKALTDELKALTAELKALKLNEVYWEDTEVFRRLTAERDAYAALAAEKCAIREVIKELGPLTLMPKKTVDEMQEQITSLTAERDALKADKARLDWLESKRLPLIPCFGIAPPMGSGLPFPFDGWVIRASDDDPKPLRDAIDAARKENP